jgi:hypothetical protein
MKKATIFFAAITLFSISGLAESTIDTYKKWLSKMSTISLTEEVGSQLLFAGWNCGAELTKKIYSALNEGKDLKNIEVGADPKCIKSSTLLEAATQEVQRRHATDGFDSEQPVIHYQFNLILPTDVTTTATETGDASCLTLARRLNTKWHSDFSWPPLDKMYSETYDTTHDVCRLERTSNSDIATGSCAYWLYQSTYNFKNNTYIQTTRDIPVYSSAEKVEREKLRNSVSFINNDVYDSARLQSLVNAANEEENMGTHFVYILRFQPGTTTSVLELRGIDGKAWMDGIYQNHKRVDELPTKCVISTQVPIQSTPVQLSQSE